MAESTLSSLCRRVMAVIMRTVGGGRQRHSKSGGQRRLRWLPSLRDGKREQPHGRSLQVVALRMLAFHSSHQL